MLHQGLNHSHHRRDAADHQHHPAAPPGQRSVQVEGDADEAVDGDLGHHPAHQRRNPAGRGRMGQRQPDVKRNDARLAPGADQRQCKHPDRQHRAVVACPHRGEGVVAIRTRHQAERKEQRPGPNPGHDQVNEGGMVGALLPMIGQHQQPGRYRHELPEKQKHQSVVGHHHQRDRRQEYRIERQNAARLRSVDPGMATMAKRKQTDRRSAEVGDKEEKRRQRV